MLETACTYLMRRFAAAHRFLRDVSERPLPDILKFISLLLCFPCFEASHACFKLAYRLNQRRLRLLCGEDLFLKVYDRRIATGGIVNILRSLRDIEGGLNGAHPSKNLGDHVLPPIAETRAPTV